MPKPTNYFLQGEEGLEGAAAQLNQISSFLNILIEDLHPNTYNKFNNWFKQNQEKVMTVTKKAGIEKGPVGKSFDYALSDEAFAKEAFKKISDAKKKVVEMKTKPRGVESQIDGFINVTERVMDTWAGDYGRAVKENAYLGPLMNMIIMGPPGKGKSMTEAVNALSDIDPATHENKGPIRYYNDFFNGLANLIDREYEKQKIVDDYTPEKEAEYLQKLNNDFKKIIDAHAGFDKFVDAEGKSAYDGYVGNSLDSMTAKNLSNFDADRSCINAIENIKGQQKAIENGWNMNELGLLGSMNELNYYLGANLKKLKKEAEKDFEAEKPTYEAALAKATKQKENREKELEEAKKKLDDLKKENKTAEEINAQQKKIDGIETSIINANQRIEACNNKINNIPQLKANAEKAYNDAKKQYDDFSKQLDKAMNKKITRISDKYEVADNYARILDTLGNFGNYPSNIEKCIKKGRNFLDTAMEFGGRKIGGEVIDPDIEAETITVADYEKYKYQMANTGKFTPYLQTADMAQYYHPGIHTKIQDDLDVSGLEEAMEDFDKLLKKPKIRSKRDGLPFEITNDLTEFDDAMKERCYKTTAIAGHAYSEIMNNDYDFYGQLKAIETSTDMEKGNNYRALGENAFLLAGFSELGGAPFLFPDKKANGDEFADKEGVRKGLNEKGLNAPLQEFFAGVSDITESEYYRQRESKKGWDADKEKYFLAKYDESCERTIKAFEELSAFDRADQKSKEFLCNQLQMITGISTNEGRDSKVFISGLKWQREGMRNGLKSNELEIFAAGGWFEGALEKYTTATRFKADDERKALEGLPDTKENEKKREEIRKNIEKYEEELRKMKEFKEKHFDPFKKKMLGIKFESSKDTLRALTELQDFVELTKTSPILAGTTIRQQNPLNGLTEHMLPTAINSCIADIKNAKKNGVSEIRNVATFEKHDSTQEIDNYAKAMRGLDKTELKGEITMKMATFMLCSTFLNGMNKEAHPEYFNRNHPDYEVCHKKLDEYMGQYADRIMKVSNATSPAEFADAIEFGDHAGMFERMKDRIDAEASKARMEAMIAGKRADKTNDKTASECITELKNAKAKALSGSTLYESIVDGMKELEQMKKKLGESILKQYNEKPEFFMAHEEKDGVKTSTWNVKPAKPIELDEKQYKAYLIKQKQVFDSVNKYLNGKDKLITEAGGNPKKKESAALLGENGEKRYNAVKNAKKAILNMRETAVDFKNKIPTLSDRQKGRMPDFSLKAENFKVAESGEIDREAYNEAVAKESKRYQDGMKFKALRERRAITNKLNAALENEEAERRASTNEYNKNKEYAKIKEDFAKLEKDFLKIKTEYSKLVEEYAPMGMNPPADKKKAYEEAQKKYQEEEKKFAEKMKPIEDAIYQSAEKALFAETVKEIYVDQHKQMYRNVLDKEKKNLDLVEQTYKQKEAEYKAKIQKSSMDRDNLDKYKDVYMDTKKAYEADRKLLEERDNRFGIGHDPAEFVSKVSLKEIQEDNKKLGDALKETLVQKPGGPQINKNSKQFENFEKGIVDNVPFKNEFRKRVLEASNKKPVNKEDICRIRDSILHDAIVKNIGNEKECARYDKLSKALGSKVNSKDILMPKEIKLDNQAKNKNKKAGAAKLV